MSKILLSEQAAPATPAAGTAFLYFKADGFLYLKNDAGVEIQIGYPFSFEGAWSAGTYNAGAIAINDGAGWLATVTTTEEPTGTPTDWEKLWQDGVDGVDADISVLPTIPVTGGTSRTIGPSDAGNMIRFEDTGAKTCTFNTTAGLSADEVYHVTNRAASGNLTLNGTCTLNPPKDGTLVLEPGDTVTVHMQSSSVGDVMGSTEPA